MKETIQLNPHWKAIFQENVLLLESLIHKRKITYDAIKGFFVHPFMIGQEMFIISYSDGSKTRVFKLPIHNEGTQSFIRQLEQMAPASANLLDKEKSEALKMLGTRDRTLVYLLTVLAIFLVLVIGTGLPSFWHGFRDTHLVPTTIEDLYNGKLPDSGFVSFSAVLGNTGLITTQRNTRGPGHGRRERGYFPLVPPQWHPGDPVKVVLLVKGGSPLKTINSHLGQAIQVSGVMRNFLWEPVLPEGLTDIFYSWREIFSGWQDRLAEKIKAPVQNPLIIAYKANPDKELFRTIMMDSFLIMVGIVAVIVAMFMRRKTMVN